MADLVESVAKSLLSQLTDIPIIRANQDGARPALPYATYQVTARTTVGSDHYSNVDGDGMQMISGVREGTIMVNFFGDDARESADNLVNSIRKTTSRYLMRRLSMVISDTGNVTDLTALRDRANFEQMANIDLFFRYTGIYTDDVGVIETVDATGTVAQESIHQTITVN